MLDGTLDTTDELTLDGMLDARDELMELPVELTFETDDPVELMLDTDEPVEDTLLMLLTELPVPAHAPMESPWARCVKRLVKFTPIVWPVPVPSG